MLTIVVSDLHLGSGSGSDLLRRPELREPLLELARRAERVVLLGDVLELRHGPAREALAAAQPVLRDLGRVPNLPEEVRSNQAAGLIVSPTLMAAVASRTLSCSVLICFRPD